MEESNPLRETLESLTKVYHSKKANVEFGSPSRAIPGLCTDVDGFLPPVVVIDPNVQERFCEELTGPEELRCVINTLSHELEHVRESDLTSKAEFMEEYENYPHFAGGVINILEDQYIDFRRTQRFPGLRSTQAFVIDKLLLDDNQWPRISEVENPSRAMLEGLRQVAFAGYAKGISEADDWLRDFLSRARTYIKRVRRESSQRRRKELAHSLMTIAQEYLPDNDDFDMPDKCAVCEDQEPVIVAPRLGPVCNECAPTEHGKSDGDGSGKKERNDTSTGTSDTATSVAASNSDKKTTQAVAGEISDTETEIDQDELTQSEKDSDLINHNQDDNQIAANLTQDGHGEPQSTELVTMDEMDLNQDTASWWNVPNDVNHRTTSKEHIARYERIQEERRRNDSLESDLRQHREDSKEADETLSPTNSGHSSNIKKSEQWQRLRDEHRRMFRKLTTQDMAIPAKKGNRVNLNNVIQQAAGNKSQRKLYNKKQKVANGNRLVAVSADLSGSMNGWQVKLALAAIAEATDMVGDDFLATCWKGTNSSTACGYKQGSAGIGLICGVNEEFKWEQLDEFQSGGGTPTADGVDITARLMEDTHAREKLMIVITDGCPSSGYGEVDERLTGNPVTDAAQMVRDTQAENIKTIGLYIGNNADNTSMSQIFGNRGFVSASIDDLAQKLVGVYQQQLRV